jgi:hypothetical protein
LPPPLSAKKTTTTAQNAKEPLVTNFAIKHSSAFNFEHASGMNQVQQLQFVELIKRMITATLDRYNHFIVVERFFR